MIFSQDANELMPEKDKDEPKKLFDLSIVKKGKNFTSKKAKGTQKSEDLMMEREEEKIINEAKEKERIAKLKEAQMD